MQPEQPQQPIMNQPTAAPLQPQPAEVPGKTLGIVGFIFAFIGLQLPGLIMSIVSLVKGRRAGTTNVLAVVGIILNVILGVITFGFFMLVGLTAWNGVQEKARAAEAQSSSSTVSQ